MGNRERAGSEVLLLGRGIGIDRTKIENPSEHGQSKIGEGRTGCTLGLFYLGYSGTVVVHCQSVG